MGVLEFYPPQLTGNGRFSQSIPCYNLGINIINALEGYSSQQVLMQMAMNLIQEFNGMNQETTIQWLDHVEVVAKKTGFDPLEIGMSKLKGTALCDISTTSKEGNLTYFWLCQLLIEHYLNIPYALDTLNAYAHLTQGENESVTQYLARAKVLLGHIHHNPKMCNIPGTGYDKLCLVRGLYSPHVWRRVASEQDIWM